MYDYDIVDNFLDENTFKTIKETLISSNFPYYYNNSINTEYDNKEQNLNTCYFTHTLFKDDVITSAYFKLLEPIFKKLKHKKILKAKVNCYPKTESLEIHKPHKDFNFKHNGFIFYLNTNNGKTVLENQVKIDSIENRALFFDSSKPHSSTNCTDVNARFNININYI